APERLWLRQPPHRRQGPQLGREVAKHRRPHRRRPATRRQGSNRRRSHRRPHVIDRRVFTAEFTLLLDRFGRDPHQLLIARYFGYLNARLTTEEFTAAARKIFEEARYWPAPIDFIEAAKGDPKRLAAEAWGQLLTAAQRGRPHDAPPDAIAA